MLMYDLRVLCGRSSSRARIANVSRLCCLNFAEKLLLYMDSDCQFFLRFHSIELFLSSNQIGVLNYSSFVQVINLNFLGIG